MKSFGWICKSICCVVLIAGLIIGGGCFGDVGFLGLQDYQRDLLVGGLAAAALLSGDGGTDGEPEPGAPGARGADGEDGAAGTSGADGADGEPGAQGEPGPAGTQGPAGQEGPPGPAGAAGSNGADGSPGADGVAFFDIFIDDFFTIAGNSDNPDGQLHVGLVSISEPALGVPVIDPNTGDEVNAVIAYRVAIPETYTSSLNDVTMRLFFFRPGADVEGCLVMTLDALRLRDGENVADYGERIWIRLEGSAKDAARASSIAGLLGEPGPSGVGFVIDVPINKASGLNGDPLAAADLLAFELATAHADDETICHDGGRYQILGVEFFEGAPGSATPVGATILGEAPETCCELECPDARTYTVDADFDEGTLINIVHDPSDQLQLDDTVEAFNFIWVAVSSKGTVVKINTLTGAVLGEYRTTPQNQGLGNPSRTTVDQDGSVWVGNRNDVSNGFGTVIHIGLEENGQCEDRHDGAGGGPDGIIQTSTGLGDVRGWTDTSGTRGVATALDECIVHYTQVNSRGTRHVSVDANNDVWVSGTGLRNFDLVKGGRYDVVSSGTIIRSETSVNFGGYGGLIDGDGVIWSARNLLRWDVANPLTGANGDPAGNDIGPPNPETNWAGQNSPDSYGLCIDGQGNVWNTQLSGDRIHKYAPDGTHLGSFPHGAGGGRAQGCVVDGNDHVWTAHSLDANRNTIGHLLNDGTFVGNVVLSDANVGPTGVAVDAAGKIWATGFNSRKVYRIDPTLGAVGGGGATIGAEDFASVDIGGQLYNYSDMTGSTLTGAPDNGTWAIIQDVGVVDSEWGTVTWTPAEPGDSSITVTAASGSDGVAFGPAENVTNGVDLTVANGQFLKVVVSFTRATKIDSDGNGVNDSPILFDLTIEPACGVEGPQ